MIGSQSAVETPAVPPSPPAGERPQRGFRLALDTPVAVTCAVCFVLAVISVLLISWVPSSDPWAWIDWGQELSASSIPAGLGGGPSWKPFPAFFTTIFGFFGGAAPHLWLVIPRLAGLLALVAAFRLGRRFAGAVAGVVAVLALCLVQDSLFYVARGASEPVVAALTLWAIDRHLHGSRRVAYFLAFLATLNRPEFAAFLFLYGLYLWLRVPGTRPLVIALLVLVPIAWLGPPKLITGNAFQAGSAALGGKGSPGSAPAELRSSVGLMSVPTLVLAAIGLGLAYVKRHKVLLWLGAAGIAWALMVAVITQVAYGLPRYLLPGGVIACVLAGVAVAWIAEALGDMIGRRAPRVRSVAIPVIAIAVLAATLPWSVTRVKSLVQQGGTANLAVRYQKNLFRAVAQAGGAARVLPCRSSIVAVNHTMASALAWKLRVRLSSVKPLMRRTGFVFSAPHTSVTGTTPPISHASAKAVRTLAVVGPWRVLEVTARGAPAAPRCAPGDHRKA
jgi:hypothetical protein